MDADGANSGGATNVGGSAIPTLTVLDAGADGGGGGTPVDASLCSTSGRPTPNGTSAPRGVGGGGGTGDPGGGGMPAALSWRWWRSWPSSSS